MEVYYPNFPIPEHLELVEKVCGVYVINSADKSVLVSGPYETTEDASRAKTTLLAKRAVEMAFG